MKIQAPWKDLLVEHLAREHVVQLYRDERNLVEAVALLGETLTPRLGACGAIILGGVALAVLGRNRS